jgi:hypothetical protein
MQIQFNPTKASELSEMLLIHSFDVYRGFTSKYRGFEVPNLTEEVKMKILHKLSPSNYLKIPPFEQFWNWFKKHHGMTLVAQMCEFLFPEDEDECQKMINRVRSNKDHSFWKHIKARVYKKWCSIVTEAQCVYAAVQGVESTKKDWKVFASAELDGIGIDFVIVNDEEVVPIQVKKDSFSAYSKNKKNTDENLTRYNLTKKAAKILEKEMAKNKVVKPMGRGLLLKYGLMNGGSLPYEYLAQYNNGFVYFKGEKLVNTLANCFTEVAEVE